MKKLFIKPPALYGCAKIRRKSAKSKTPEQITSIYSKKAIYTFYNKKPRPASFVRSQARFFYASPAVTAENRPVGSAPATRYRADAESVSTTVRFEILLSVITSDGRIDQFLRTHLELHGQNVRNPHGIIQTGLLVGHDARSPLRRILDHPRNRFGQLLMGRSKHFVHSHGSVGFDDNPDLHHSFDLLLFHIGRILYARKHPFPILFEPFILKRRGFFQTCDLAIRNDQSLGRRCRSRRTRGIGRSLSHRG